MMDISEIKQYAHKIIKINITNTNKTTNYSYTTIKIHLEKEQNEVIRFSYEENSNWIEHQSKDNDYFLRIPNIVDSITHIYAHFFPADLYSYIEDSDLFSLYDFSDFFKENPTDPLYNERYPLQITSYGYEMMLGEENKPYIRSLLDKSITKYKDPNYKQYTVTDASSNIDMTEQGRFPLSSRYRNSRYATAPQFNQGNLPYWQKNDKRYSYGTFPNISTEIYQNDTYTYQNISDTSINNNNKYTESSNCTEIFNQIPFWEAKIHRKGLSPFITDEYAEDMESESSETPFNVYLNYQYLPTSTEYHQHYYGFEPYNVKNQAGEEVARINMPEAISVLGDNLATETNRQKLIKFCENIKNGTWRQVTENKNLEVLDGENLYQINKAFNNQATYRLINHGNPFDDANIMTIDHTNIIDLDLDQAKITKNCTWEKNNCDKYWTLTPLSDNSEDSLVYLDVKLKANTPYVLKYYIYIPADAYVEDSSNRTDYKTLTEKEELAADTCFITVQNTINGNSEIIGQLNKEFRHQDKQLRHQWVYHEIPFFTLEADTRIVIKGPKHSVEDFYTYNTITGEINIKEDKSFTEEEKESAKLELHNCTNDIIHFYKIQIAEMVEYSPTLKYTNTGLYIVEKDKYAKKPLKNAHNNQCMIKSIDSGIKKWENQTENIPIPFNDIYISFGNDFEIIYNELTSEISWTQGNYPFAFKNYNKTFDTTLGWEANQNEIKLQYEELLSGLTEDEYNKKKNTDGIGEENHTDRTDDNNQYKLKQGNWSLYRENFTTFTNGINNEFELTIQDSYGNAITSGTIECAIFTEKDEKANCADALRCFGEKTPNEYGKIEYKNLNFRTFKPTGKYTETIKTLDDDGNEKEETITKNIEYWLRIKYNNPCYGKTIIKWKQLIFIQEHANMIISANTCFDTETNYINDICNDIDKIISNKCCKYCTSSYYDTENDTYQSQKILRKSGDITVNGPKIYNITNINDFPLRLDVSIRSEPVTNYPDGIILNEGYCELSVNDSVIQSTYVDSNGIADFYLDREDLNPGIHTIKVEYYRQKNYEVLNYAYFIINCTYEDKPVVPIKIRPIYDTISDSEEEVNIQLNNNIYKISNVNDLLLIDIESESSNNFSITIQKQNNDTGIYETTDEYNIYNSLDNDIIAIEKTDSDNITRYKIITDNLKDDNGDYINNIYSKNEKKIIIYWGSHQNYSEV